MQRKVPVHFYSRQVLWVAQTLCAYWLTWLKNKQNYIYMKLIICPGQAGCLWQKQEESWVSCSHCCKMGSPRLDRGLPTRCHESAHIFGGWCVWKLEMSPPLLMNARVKAVPPLPLWDMLQIDVQCCEICKDLALHSGSGPFGVWCQHSILCAPCVREDCLPWKCWEIMPQGGGCFLILDQLKPNY